MSDGPTGSSSQSPTPIGDTKDKSLYMQLSCSYCKFKKRKCDGESPCFNCRKHNQACIYFAESDRRRRKYHTDYISYLEGKSENLMKFIKEFVKDSPELYRAFDEKLAHAIEISHSKQQRSKKGGASDPNNDVPTSVPTDDELLRILEELRKLKLDEDDESRVLNSSSLMSHSSEYEGLSSLAGLSPYSELTSSNLDAPTSQDFNPLAMNGLNITFKDESFKNHLIESFETHFSDYAYSFKVLLPEVKQWEFASPVPSKQLLLCSIFAIGAVYSDHPYALNSRKIFISELEYIAINACRYPLDIYLVLGLSLLSIYELGMGNDSISYLFNSMACSLTQHMGLHISYDKTGDLKSASYAPKTSPLSSSTLWGICLQDRIITSICNVQSCIHFKRIITPVYQATLSPDHPDYMCELSFAYQTRLWYIYDRFMDQICSETGDIGDTLQRTKILETALNSMNEFKNSLPLPLLLNTDSLDRHALVLHYTYYSLICHYHKAFIKIGPKSSQNLLSNALQLGKILKMYSENFIFEALPCNLSYLIYSNALAYLVVLVKEDDLVNSGIKIDKTRLELQEYFAVSIQLLTALSTIWKRPKKDLKILKTLCQQSGVHFERFEQDSGFSFKSETPAEVEHDYQSGSNQQFPLTSPVSSDYNSVDMRSDFDHSPFAPPNPSTHFFDLHSIAQMQEAAQGQFPKQEQPVPLQMRSYVPQAHEIRPQQQQFQMPQQQYTQQQLNFQVPMYHSMLDQIPVNATQSVPQVSANVPRAPQVLQHVQQNVVPDIRRPPIQNVMGLPFQRDEEFLDLMNQFYPGQIPSPMFNQGSPIGHPHVNSEVNPQLNPQLNPQINPQINPQLNPQLNPQINPHINPQLNPQISPQINPQVHVSMHSLVHNQSPNMYDQVANSAGPNQKRDIYECQRDTYRGI